MKLVQTLVVRDEADIVDAQIAYHLNAGVDFVIASDHESLDGTTEILDRTSVADTCCEFRSRAKFGKLTGVHAWLASPRRSIAPTG